MSLLSYNELCELVERGVIEGSDIENVNSASIDLVLGPKIMVEKQEYRDPPYEYPRSEFDLKTISMLDKNADIFETIEMTDEGYVVPPGGCVLAHSVEIFTLPNNISGEYMLKSTQARNFYGHLKAGWADAGWNGSVLTLEFVNHLQYHNTLIKPGMKCGQIIFFEHEAVPSDRSYATRGQYNGDKSVNAGKGLR